MELSIPFAEMDLFPDDARSASEAMLTCTTYCLAPVASIEETRYPAERPIFERLLAAWSERVGCDIRVR